MSWEPPEVHSETELSAPHQAERKVEMTISEEISEWCEPVQKTSIDPSRYKGKFWLWVPNQQRWTPRWSFGHLNACGIFEGLLENRGCADAYETALREVLRETAEYPMPREAPIRPFAFATATADQRCEAMLRVIRRKIMTEQDTTYGKFIAITTSVTDNGDTELYALDEDGRVWKYWPEQPPFRKAMGWPAGWRELNSRRFPLEEGS